MAALPLGFLAPGQPLYVPAGGGGGGGAVEDVVCSTLTVADNANLYCPTKVFNDLTVAPVANPLNEFQVFESNSLITATVDAQPPNVAVLQVRGLDPTAFPPVVSTVLSLSTQPAISQITFAQRVPGAPDPAPQFIIQKTTNQHTLEVLDVSNSTGIILDNGGMQLATLGYLDFLINGIQPAGATTRISSIDGAIAIPSSTVTPTDLTSSFAAIPFFDHSISWTDVVNITAGPVDAADYLEYVIEGKTISYTLDTIPLSEISSLSSVTRSHNYRWLSTDADDDDCVLQAFVASGKGSVDITIQKNARIQVLGPVVP